MSRDPGNRRPWWFARLLGPNEPELGCDECFAQLDRYVELELTGKDVGAEMPRLKTHLRACKACREEHDDLLDFIRSEER